MAFEIASAGRFDWGVIAGNKEGFSLALCTPYQNGLKWCQTLDSYCQIRNKATGPGAPVCTQG